MSTLRKTYKPSYKSTHRGRLINLLNVSNYWGPYESKDFNDIVLFWVEPTIEINKKWQVVTVYDIDNNLSLTPMVGFANRPEAQVYSLTLYFDDRIRDEFELPNDYQYTTEQEIRKLLRMVTPVVQKVPSSDNSSSSYGIALPPCLLVTPFVNAKGFITNLSISDTVINSEGQRVACQVNIEFTETEIREAEVGESKAQENLESKIVVADSDTFLLQLLHKHAPQKPWDINYSMLRTQSSNPNLKYIIKRGTQVKLVYYILPSK